MINYRFDIKKKLGQGGSGEVFLAEDLLNNRRQCAVKILHGNELAGEAESAFRNEVSVLLQLEHPNLVRIHDFGIVRTASTDSLRGRRFLAMEYVHGVDALDWFSRIRDAENRETLTGIILLQALSALSYVHREKIVHFDVKPQNLVLVGESSPSTIPVLKLMDFGFSAKQEDATGLSIRGTLEYTAPELLRGESNDHRVDLYSLGATFYHLLYGRCPFEAPDPVELVKLALNAEPPFDGSQSTNVQSMIARLLQKNPDKRFRDAEEAARLLVKGEANANELLESYFGVSKKSRFVGRKTECKILQGSIDAIAKNHADVPRAFVVLGAEGIGKTSLLGEAAKYARANDLTVTWTDATSTGIPFDGIYQVINQLGMIAKSWSAAGESIVEKYASELFRDDKSGLLRAWTKESEKSIELLSRFVVDCMSAFPFLIIADNCHQLDLQSLGVLQSVLRDMHSGKSLILAAETSDAAEVTTSLPGEILRLQEMTGAEVSEMSKSIFGDAERSEQIGLSIFNLYGGIPGIVVEALSAARDVMTEQSSNLSVTRQDIDTNLESSLPRTLDDFLIRRFKKMNGERQLILSVLSCFQHAAPAEIVTGILPFHPRRFVDQLRYLQLEGFVSESENNTLVIKMKRLKEAVYASIHEQHAELHGLIAESLEQQFSRGSFLQLQELASQFLWCGRKDKATTYLEEAASVGLQLFAFARSLQLYRQAIGIAQELGDVHREISLRLKLTAALFRSGAYNDVVQSANELKDDEALSTEGRFLLYKELGLSLSRLGEIEPAQMHIRTALSLTHDEVERLELNQELISTKISTGLFQEAEKDCHEQLEIANRLKQERLVASVYTDLGISAFYQNRYSYAAECFAQALRQFESLNEQTQVINSMNNISNALNAAGEHSKAIEFLRKGLAASKDHGTLMQQAQITNNLGISHYKLKKFVKAKELYAEARELYERASSRSGVAGTLANLGEVQCADGDYEEAARNLRSAYETYAQLDDPHAILDSCLHLAEVYIIIGDQKSVSGVLNEAAELLRRDDLVPFTSTYQFLRAQELMLAKQYADASDLLRKVIAGPDDSLSSELTSAAKLKLAECRHQLSDYAGARETLNALLAPNTAQRTVAEANYQLGLISMIAPDAVSERTLIYLKRGLDAIVKEPVSEITWKLAFALAREYYERGQRERAKEFLLKTKLVLQYFLSRFQSSELRNLYLGVDQKRDVLATIDALTKQ